MLAAQEYSITATSKITLEKEYECDIAQAIAEAEVASHFTIDVYKAAAEACPIKLNSVTTAKCIQDYVNQHATTGQNPIKPREIDKSKYSLAFTSPRWAWDQAGWLFAGGTALVAVSLVGRIINSIAQLMYRRDHNKPMSASLPTLHHKD